MPFMTPLLYLRLCGTPSSSHSLFRRCLDSKFDTCVQEPICNSAAIHFSVILVSARELNCATCAYTTYHQPCVNVWDPFQQRISVQGCGSFVHSHVADLPSCRLSVADSFSPFVWRREPIFRISMRLVYRCIKRTDDVLLQKKNIVARSKTQTVAVFYSDVETIITGKLTLPRD